MPIQHQFSLSICADANQQKETAHDEIHLLILIPCFHHFPFSSAKSSPQLSRRAQGTPGISSERRRPSCAAPCSPPWCHPSRASPAPSRSPAPPRGDPGRPWGRSRPMPHLPGDGDTRGIADAYPGTPCMAYLPIYIEVVLGVETSAVSVYFSVFLMQRNI